MSYVFSCPHDGEEISADSWEDLQRAVGKHIRDNHGSQARIDYLKKTAVSV